MYEVVFSDEFKKQLAKLKKKDKKNFERLIRKIKEILIEPNRFKHLKNVLKGEQRIHIRPFVLKFNVKENRVYFITFKHHDSAY